MLTRNKKRFNTSHVTLYLSRRHIYPHWNRFQYISCYSLSRINNVAIFCDPEFQYISCYSLSQSTFHHLLNCLLFQYISCYSLSKAFLLIRKTMIRFNTSHVTLYRITGRKRKKRKQVSIHLMLLFIFVGSMAASFIPSFNTSHVTLYPSTLQHFSHLTFL